jgi:hypothetical protein
MGTVTKRHQPGFLTWKSPGRVPQVLLYHDVIDRMTVDVMRGFGVTRRRGTEVGGVLLGKIAAGDSAAVHIYDYETVPCEYSQGPSYVLSDRDLQAFRETVARWRNDISPDQYVVGYFRSHTRDGLYLEPTDVQVFREFVKDPLAVALVVKPYATRASEAGFFLQSDGSLDTQPAPPEFQLVRAESAVVRERRPVARTFPAAVPADDDDSPADSTVPRSVDLAPVPDRPAATRPAPEPLEPPRRIDVGRPSSPMFGTYYQPQLSWRSRAAWVAFTLAAFGLGAVVGFEYGGGHIRGLGSPAEAAPAKGVADAYSIRLTAVEQGESVLVRWDRDSEAVKAALHGVLTIIEDGASKEVKLVFPELRNGTVLYRKVGQEVAFKLDLYFKQNRVLTESVTLRFPLK